MTVILLLDCTAKWLLTVWPYRN